MNCGPGRHDWEIVTVVRDGKEAQFRRCDRPGCERWDEMRGLWTVIDRLENRVPPSPA